MLINFLSQVFGAHVTILYQRRAEHFLDAECRVMGDGHLLEVLK